MIKKCLIFILGIALFLFFRDMLQYSYLPCLCKAGDAVFLQLLWKDNRLAFVPSQFGHVL